MQMHRACVHCPLNPGKIAVSLLPATFLLVPRRVVCTPRLGSLSKKRLGSVRSGVHLCLMSCALVPLQFSLSLSPGEQIPAIVPLWRPAQQGPELGRALLFL